MRILGRLGVLAASMAVLSSVASGYYHWTFFASREGPFQSMRLRFDLNALPLQTVSFFIAKSGPAQLVEGDRFTALASQIRRAGETWNVPGSALTVRFGGYQEKPFTDVLAEQVTPGIDVVFDDELPPGVLALSEPLTYTDIHYLGEKTSPGFAPILRSRLQLASDLAARNQASWSDAFFLTIVHEFGHTLGLQHSTTGGAMATSITRGTSKAKPLTADDVAGLAVLYPTPEFQGATGVIEGKVQVAGAGVNLASVVALSADGTAVGSMTLPDGTYRIEGLPPGDYRVYTHPLPPAQEGEANPAGIVPPQDLEHEPFLAASDFETRFYPNTMDWTAAALVKVAAARSTGGVDFDLQPLASLGLYNLRVFAYLGENRDKIVHAPPLPAGFRDWLAVQASGIVNDGQILPGLTFSAVGDAGKLEQPTLRNFPNSDEFLLIVGDGLNVERPTPVAVVMGTDTDIYVLPNAFTVVPSKHPTLTSVESYTDSLGRPHARIGGENLSSATQVVFDGSDALSVKLGPDGRLEVAAPPASGEYIAGVELLGADGQTSQQLSGDGAPMLFRYQVPENPYLTLTPGEIAAGTDAMVQLDGTFTDFLENETVVGFGSSDVVVKQWWLVNRNRILMNVSAKPQAKPGAVSSTISTGLQFVTEGPQLLVLPLDEKQISLFAPLINEATGLSGVPEGGTVLLQASGLPEDLTGWLADFGALKAPILRGADGLTRVVIPNGIGKGPQAVRLTGPGGTASPSVLVQIDGPAPVILSAVAPSGVALSAAQFFNQGDRVTLFVTGLSEGGDPVDASQVLVRIAGLRQKVDLLEPAGQPGVHKLEFMIPANAPAGESQAVTVAVGTRVSAAFAIGILAPAEPAK